MQDQQQQQQSWTNAVLGSILIPRMNGTTRTMTIDDDVDDDEDASASINAIDALVGKFRFI